MEQPVPVPNPLTAPYWQACRRGELALQRCAACRRFVHFPERTCPYCGGDELPFQTVSGRGTVHTFTIVYRTFLPGFQPPYALAWVDLDEGPRTFGKVIDAAPQRIHIDMPVRVSFTNLPGFGPIPHWRPDE